MLLAKLFHVKQFKMKQKTAPTGMGAAFLYRGIMLVGLFRNFNDKLHIVVMLNLRGFVLHPQLIHHVNGFVDGVIKNAHVLAVGAPLAQAGIALLVGNLVKLLFNERLGFGYVQLIIAHLLQNFHLRRLIGQL